MGRQHVSERTEFLVLPVLWIMAGEDAAARSAIPRFAACRGAISAPAHHDLVGDEVGRCPSTVPRHSAAWPYGWAAGFCVWRGQFLSPNLQTQPTSLRIFHKSIHANRIRDSGAGIANEIDNTMRVSQ